MKLSKISILVGAFGASVAMMVSPACSGKTEYMKACPLGEVCQDGGGGSLTTTTTSTTSTTGGGPTCSDAIQNGGESDIDCGGPCAPCDDGKKCTKEGDCVSSVCTMSLCVTATCTDAVKNADETDVDCGGSCKTPCAVGKTCGKDVDCVGGDCVSGMCVAPACNDAKKDGDETGLDCGGSCPTKCPDGSTCVVKTDCLSGVCAMDLTCSAPSCTDTVKNGDETDVDCGGSCPACKVGLKCVTGADCASLACPAGTCTSPACSDLVQNGVETDVDCGGSVCAPCADLKACVLGTDCTSSVCTAGHCAVPTCTDGKKNGTETDIDCGGAACPVCVLGQKCVKGTDCATASCVGGVCAAPTCADTVKNGNETDVDCGGPTCPACLPNKLCEASTDCTSHICTANHCTTPVCNDAVKNGTETDIDCGGAGCATCPLGKKCLINSDCVGSTCTGGTCGCPAGMIVVPKIGGGFYCIDGAEVTYTQYTTFYSANPSTATQPAFCSWSTNYTPAGDWPPTPQQGTEPVRYVTWCQADAYCRYLGRHLCGKVDGGATPSAGLADAHVDEWYNACSAQGANAFPYGTAFSASKCPSAAVPMDGGPPLSGPVPATLFPNCLGGEVGLLDMSGNVAEWENSCDNTTGINDVCVVRGGSYQSSTAGPLSCDSGGTSDGRTRTYTGKDVGIRCCL